MSLNKIPMLLDFFDYCTPFLTPIFLGVEKKPIGIWNWYHPKKK